MTQQASLFSSTALLLELEANRLAPRRARRALEQLDLGGRVMSVLELLACELVTNSVLHGSRSARDRIGVEVELSPRTVRVEITDAGPGFSPHPGRQAPDDERGRGLVLVDGLADRWGVHAGPPAQVWFELGR